MTEPDHRTYTSLDSEGEAAVGRVSIWAAWVEEAIADLFSSLIGGVNGAGAIVSNDMMASKLIDLSRKLLKNEYSAIPQLLQDKTTLALDRASAALQQRNMIIHGTVGGSLDPGKTAFHNRKRRGTAYFYNAAELDAMGQHLHACIDEIFDCSWAIEGHLSSRT